MLPIRIADSIYITIAAPEMKRLLRMNPALADVLYLRFGHGDEAGRPISYSTVLDAKLLSEIKGLGIKVDIDPSQSSVSEDKMATVSRGNRFEAAMAVKKYDPFDGHIANLYLNSVEIETYVAQLHTIYPETVCLIPLPHETCEGRVTNAVRIGAPSRTSETQRSSIFLCGGVHGNEWPGPDICIGFIDRYAKALNEGTCIDIGECKISAEAIQRIASAFDIYVFPNVNPDGRTYSQDHGVQWRKNRNGSFAEERHEIGVDINRNFDFLWKTGYGSRGEMHSPVYKGPRRESEPETKNLMHLLSAIGKPKLVMDLHAYRKHLLHSWGNAETQSRDSRQSFRSCETSPPMNCNPALGYSEYLPLNYSAAISAAARELLDLMTSTGLDDYQSKSIRDFYRESVCGTFCDRAFARNTFAIDQEPETLSFALEVGSEYQPPYAEVIAVTRAVTAALLGFCRSRLE